MARLDPRDGTARDLHTRPRRFSWFDPRLAIGVLLVVGSAAGVTYIVSSADRTSEVYAAANAVVAGDHISAADLTIVHVRLGDAIDHYLEPSELPSDGMMAVQSIAEGELVPDGSVGLGESDEVAPVVVPLDGELPGSIGEGSRVAVWASPATEGGNFGAPAVIVPDATVVRVVTPTGLVSAADRGEQVEIRVPRETVAVVLEATANGSSLALVPSDLPLGR